MLVVAATLVGCSVPVERLAPEPWPPAGPARPSVQPTPAPSPADPPPERAPADVPPEAPAPPAQGPVRDPDACAGVDNTLRSWYYRPAAAGQVPTVPAEVAAIVARYGVLWRMPTSERVIYLTFDQGYEAGFTARILDTLRDKNVRATFFLTGSYVRNQPDLVRRMVAEGHVVGNHTQSHPSLPGIASDPRAFSEEYRAVERAFRAATGQSLAALERPPRGEYSERTLCMARALGYTSVMWSFAHRDWLLDDQPPVDVTYQRIVDGAHPGAIMLLHSVSESNTLALPRAIDELRRRGYRFAALDDAR
ncbi:MAG TPA: polysaccharide deacetylase family protein [Coriobacteriia bacterium]|nr:polysaccharide deacetylase family protein [Coriobacteriia bacterium]